MSVPGILFNVGLGLLGTNQTEARSTSKQGKQDFEQLLEAMQKGDLAAAQQALSGIQQAQATVQGNTPVSTTSTDAASAAAPLATDFSVLGSALKSGNLTAAQEAFAKLQQDFLSLRPQGSSYGSLDHAAEIYAMLQRFGATGAGGPTTGSVNAFLSTMDKVNGEVGTLKQALQAGDQSLSQDTLARLLQDLRASSLLGRPQAPAASALLASA